MEETKPVPQVGSRWKFNGDVYRVTDGPDKWGMVAVTWERGPRDDVPQVGRCRIQDGSDYLGTISPQGEPGVVVGQRWQLNGDVYRVADEPDRHGMVAIIWERPDGPEVLQAGRCRIQDGESVLLPSPSPSTAPATAEQVNGGPLAADSKFTPGQKVIVSAKPPRREVSANGRDWVDFDRLTDSDAWEAYRHRRLDGVVVAAVVEAPRVMVVGAYGDNENTHRLFPGTFKRMSKFKPWSSLDGYDERSRPVPWRPSVDDVDLLCGDVL